MVRWHFQQEEVFFGNALVFFYLSGIYLDPTAAAAFFAIVTRSIVLWMGGPGRRLLLRKNTEHAHCSDHPKTVTALI